MKNLLIAIIVIGCSRQNSLNEVQKDLTNAGWEVTSKNHRELEAWREGNQFLVYDLMGKNHTIMFLKPEVYHNVRRQLDSEGIDYNFSNRGLHRISYDGSLIPDVLDVRKNNYDSIVLKVN